MSGRIGRGLRCCCVLMSHDTIVRMYCLRRTKSRSERSCVWFCGDSGIECSTAITDGTFDVEGVIVSPKPQRWQCSLVLPVYIICPGAPVLCLVTTAGFRFMADQSMYGDHSSIQLNHSKCSAMKLSYDTAARNSFASRRSRYLFPWLTGVGWGEGGRGG